MYSSVVKCYNSNNAGFCKLIINYTDITNILYFSRNSLTGGVRYDEPSIYEQTEFP